MRLRFILTLIIPLCSICVSSVSALESSSLIIIAAGPQAFPKPTTGESPPLVPQSGNIIVRGSLNLPGMRLPTINHVGLYTSQGQPVPLWIDDVSLVFEGDRISSLNLAFEIPASPGPPPLLKLVWSNDPAPLADNLVIDGLVVAAAAQSDVMTFMLKPSLSGPAVANSTIIVEVDSRQRLYQAWYLIPILLILALAALGRYGLREKGRA